MRLNHLETIPHLLVRANIVFHILAPGAAPICSACPTSMGSVHQKLHRPSGPRHPELYGVTGLSPRLHAEHKLRTWGPCSALASQPSTALVSMESPHSFLRERQPSKSACLTLMHTVLRQWDVTEVTGCRCSRRSSLVTAGPPAARASIPGSPQVAVSWSVRCRLLAWHLVWAAAPLEDPGLTLTPVGRGVPSPPGPRALTQVPSWARLRSHMAHVICMKLELQLLLISCYL